MGVELINGRDRDREFAMFLSYATKYENIAGYEPTGELKFFVRKGLPWPSTVLTQGIYPYVVSPLGEIRVAGLSRPAGKISHPELMKGKPIIAGGMVEINDGFIMSLSNASGHYLPDPECLFFARTVFEFWAAPLSPDLEIKVVHPLGRSPIRR